MLDMDTVITDASLLLGASRAEIISHDTSRRPAWARHVVAYLLRAEGWAYRDIGKAMARQPSAVHHSVGIVEETMAEDSEARSEVEWVQAGVRCDAAGPIGHGPALVRIRSVAAALHAATVVHQDAAAMAESAAAELLLIARRVRASERAMVAGRACA